MPWCNIAAAACRHDAISGAATIDARRFLHTRPTTAARCRRMSRCLLLSLSAAFHRMLSAFVPVSALMQSAFPDFSDTPFSLFWFIFAGFVVSRPEFAAQRFQCAFFRASFFSAAFSPVYCIEYFFFIFLSSFLPMPFRRLYYFLLIFQILALKEVFISFSFLFFSDFSLYSDRMFSSFLLLSSLSQVIFFSW